ncbi:hypothetical protein PGT21_014286 [Puccinia graminis f. sp. tritici]|uniref:Uncharacterized protein n=1 Tax=Puccinia graminis f. sp. tritici TaxID=56615 RepID=A0A5B0MEV0_PUCGR|nr:hypothetical protein PGT21_014286 [Puccinia graminis f. sp. tritici]
MADFGVQSSQKNDYQGIPEDVLSQDGPKKQKKVHTHYETQSQPRFEVLDSSPSAYPDQTFMPPGVEDVITNHITTNSHIHTEKLRKSQ